MRYLIFSLLLVFFSCTKDPQFIGTDVLERTDNIGYFEDDSFSIHTLSIDSVASANYSYGLIGSYGDPIFGFAKSEFLAQVFPETFLNLPNEVKTIDSIFFYLSIKDYYGKFNGSININIYEMIVDIDSATHSNFNPFGKTKSIKWNLNTIVTKSDTILKLALDINAFKTALIDPGATMYTSEAEFLSQFKGFYFNVDNITTEDGAILRIDLSSSNTKMALFYKNQLNESKIFNFAINTSYCHRVNLFSHDYFTSIFNPILNDTINSDSIGYIQSMSGTRLQINIVNAANWPTDVIINKAELIVPVKVDANYPAPEKLTILMLHEGKEGIVPDDPYITSSSYYGGVYNEIDESYHFNISLFAQQMVKKKISVKKLYLFTGYHSSSSVLYFNSNIANRVQIENSLARGVKIK